jgi:hypothetical protein
MLRLNPIPNARCNAGALSALAVAVGLMSFVATPARADHAEATFGVFFGIPVPVFPVPVPVPVPVVVRPVVYPAPVVYPVVYEQPYYAPVVQHVHYGGCRHDGWDRGRGHGHGHGGHDRWDDHRDR